MNWVKGFALVTCLATPLPVILATSAEAAPAADLRSAASAGPMIHKAAMSDDEKAAKKAKATDCSRQADAKKLHGEARRKFRDTCKKS